MEDGSNLIWKKALQAVKEETFSVSNATKQFCVPRATLQRHLEGKNKYSVGGKQHFGSPTVLSKQQEDDIVQQILDLEAMLFGVSKQVVQHLAYELAIRNNASLAHKFNGDKKCAGRKWFRNFMSRNPQLSYRTPEGTSIGRAAGFNKENVNRFYDILEMVLDKFKFDATTIYNMDETSRSTVQEPGKVLARKGKHQVGAIVSAERGTSVTCVCCVSASGSYLRPFLIYKRKRMRDELKTGFAVQDNGWMDKDTFCLWLEHFIKHTKPSKETPILLILDGHVSHTGNLRAIELAAKHGVIMLSLPPHCSHRMQPLDLTYFKPLSTYFNQAIDKFMRTHPGSCVQPLNIAGLLDEAFKLASVVATAVKGFEKAGIWPPNRSVFSDADFMPLPRKSTISNRRRRCQQSELITSSPYKKKLMESETIKKKGAPKRRPALGLQQNRNKTRPKTQGKKTSTAKPAEEESWFCFICSEDLNEAMTRCISCSHWVHNKCADETKLVGLQHVCDLCT